MLVKYHTFSRKPYNFSLMKYNKILGRTVSFWHSWKQHGVVVMRFETVHGLFTMSLAGVQSPFFTIHSKHHLKFHNPLLPWMNTCSAAQYYTVRSGSCCALIKGVGINVHKCLYSKNWIQQLHTLPVLHFNRCLTTEYSEKQQHTSTATLILTTKSTGSASETWRFLNG
jgi:hypothetical protein